MYNVDIMSEHDGTHNRWVCSCGAQGTPLYFREEVQRLGDSHLEIRHGIVPAPELCPQCLDRYLAYGYCSSCEYGDLEDDDGRSEWEQDGQDIMSTGLEGRGQERRVVQLQEGSHDGVQLDDAAVPPGSDQRDNGHQSGDRTPDASTQLIGSLGEVD